MESGLVPTLLGSDSNLGRASTSSAYIQLLLSCDVACHTDHLETHTVVGTQLSLKTFPPHFTNEEDCDAFGDRSTQRGATSKNLDVDGPGSSHMSSHSGELKILSVYGKGEGPLAVDGHDTLFIASEVEALNSLSADHSVAKSLERGERLVCQEELSVQQTPDAISIKVEEDIGGGLPAVEDSDAFGDRSTQRGATSESLGVDGPGFSHMSSNSGELKILSVYGKGEGPLAEDGHETLFTTSEVEDLNSLSVDHRTAKSLGRGERLVRHEELSVQQTPDTISIKVEEDVDGGMHAGEDGNDIRDCSTQRGATSESLRVDALSSSDMARHNGELRILSVYGQGEGPLAMDGHDTLIAPSELEALSSLSADRSVAESLERSVRLVRLEELTGHQGGRKGRPGVLCGKVFPNNANMIVHMRTQPDDKPYGCDQCTKRFRLQRDLKIHMLTHTGEQTYSCDQCTKSFSRTSYLNRHMRTHTGEKPYKCDQCTKSFGQKGTLNLHMRTHTREKPYQCDQCTKSFRQHCYLKIHMRTHTGEKPYKCDQCAKRFSRKGDLKIHRSSHTREMPYRCDQCTMRFSLTGTLKLHMRTHTGEMPYKCDQCTNCFSQKSYLKSHMWTHSGEKPYKCDHCTKRFSRKGNLKIHMRTHSGEKPYRCDQCTMRFNQSCKLKIHMRNHTGEKPYVCLQCNASYSNQRKLSVHMLKHTG